MDWDTLDDEIRRELDNISLDDSETTSRSTTRSSSPSHPPHSTEVADVSTLFRGYHDMTGGADGVDQVLSDVRDLIHTSPAAVPSPHHHLTVSEEGSQSSVTMVSPLSGPEAVGSGVLQLVNGVGEERCDPSNGLEDCDNRQYLVGDWEKEQQLLEEQQKKELELNALIEESQRKLKERKQILYEREKHRAAVKIQALTRGYLSRQRYKSLFTLKTKLVTVIQTSWRGYQARVRRKSLMRAILDIQLRWKIYRLKQRRLKAILCLQKHWRTHLLAKRVRAATLLQRAWRRHRLLVQLHADNDVLQPSDDSPDPLQTNNVVLSEQSSDPISSPQSEFLDEKSPELVQPKLTMLDEQSPDPQSLPKSTMRDRLSPDPQLLPKLTVQDRLSPDPQSLPKSTMRDRLSPDPQLLPKVTVQDRLSPDPQSLPKLTVQDRLSPDPVFAGQIPSVVLDKQSPDPILTPQPGSNMLDQQSPDPMPTLRPDNEMTTSKQAANIFTSSQPKEHMNQELRVKNPVKESNYNALVKTTDKDQRQSETSDQQSHFCQVAPAETISSPRSPNKLTISRRIQSALRLVQSSSTDQLEMADGDSLRETRSQSLSTTTKRTLSGMKWSQLRVSKDMLASVLAPDQEKKVPEVKSSPALETIRTEQHRDNMVPTECDSAQPISKDKQGETCAAKPEESHRLHPPVSRLLSEPTQSQVLTESTPPLDGTISEAREAHDELVESERLALEEMRERRQREVDLANQSRLRMSRLISEEEIQQVAKQKKAHNTYRNELDFAAQPLSPKAWCGLISERLEQWKKRHHRWTRPTPPELSTHLAHPHPTHTGTPLTSAQIVAASPKDTPPDQVAMVIMYRSRNSVNLSSLMMCPRLATLSLTKCGLGSLSQLEKCGQLQEVKVQSNNIEHVDLTGLGSLCFADLSNNRLASIHGFQSCTKLLTLDLSENRLARLAGLEGCHHLQKLVVDGNLIINSKGLSSVPLLQWLSCSENHLPRVEGLERCSLLQHLNLAQNNLQQAPLLFEHVLLRELRLEGNSLSDVGPFSQAWLPLLQTLSLANNCIAELAPLSWMVMLGTLDVSNNSLYDLPVLLQCIRGCYQLRELAISGNPVCEESKFRYYISKALPCLETLDETPLRSKAPLPGVVSSSSVYQLCLRQISEQDAARQSLATEQMEGGDGPPSPDSVVRTLKDKVSGCRDYQSLLISHLREHERLVMRDGSPPAALPRYGLTRQTRAAVKIQAAWRGFKGRRWAQRLRQIYDRAATVIQANYRGYSLRVRLRKVLENARYMGEGCGPCDGCEGVESEDGVDFEEEIVVDYLDESALDRELSPLSPREPLPVLWTRHRESLVKFGGRPQIEAASPAASGEGPPMVPLYSLPGCVEAEVTLKEWRQMQRTSQVEPTQEIVEKSFGNSATGEENVPVKGNPLAAWGSTTDMDGEIQRSESKQDKMERIVNEWGLQSSSTAKLMMKRAQRQKKLRKEAVRRKQFEDPSVRLAAFRRKAPPTHVLKAQQNLYKDHSPATQPENPHNQADFVYQWVNNPTLMHEADCRQIQRGSSLLPPMEPRILAGQPPQLVSSSGQGQLGRSRCTIGSSSYPSVNSKSTVNYETSSTSNIM